MKLAKKAESRKKVCGTKEKKSCKCDEKKNSFLRSAPKSNGIIISKIFNRLIYRRKKAQLKLISEGFPMKSALGSWKFYNFFKFFPSFFSVKKAVSTKKMISDGILFFSSLNWPNGYIAYVARMCRETVAHRRKRNNSIDGSPFFLSSFSSSTRLHQKDQDPSIIFFAACIISIFGSIMIINKLWTQNSALDESLFFVHGWWVSESET